MAAQRQTRLSPKFRVRGSPVNRAFSRRVLSIQGQRHLKEAFKCRRANKHLSFQRNALQWFILRQLVRSASPRSCQREPC